MLELATQICGTCRQVALQALVDIERRRKGGIKEPVVALQRMLKDKCATARGPVWAGPPEGEARRGGDNGSLWQP